MGLGGAPFLTLEHLHQTLVLGTLSRKHYSIIIFNFVDHGSTAMVVKCVGSFVIIFELNHLVVCFVGCGILLLFILNWLFLT
jgi:hypothetical protein